jgi:hypothetical protein
LSIDYCLLVIESAAGTQVLGLAFAVETDFPRMRVRKFIRSRVAGRALLSDQRSFFNPQLSIHLKEALAQRTFPIAAKLGLITRSFAGEEL